MNTTLKNSSVCSTILEGKLKLLLISQVSRVEYKLTHLLLSVLLVEIPKGLITFTRRKVNSNNLPEWSTQKSKLLEVSISEEGRIEDAPGTLQVHSIERKLFKI